MTLAGIWVECPREFDDLSGMEQRSYNSQRYSGAVQDTYQNPVSFNPDRLHGSGGFEGERFVNTAYQSRNARVAPVDHVDYLKKLNFSPVLKQVTFLPSTSMGERDVNADQGTVSTPRPSANNDTEKVAALESSSESEGEDGIFEARRAAQQARKKEVHWQSMRSEEVEPFVEALKKAWSEWERWSSCKEIKVAPDRWKPVPEVNEPRPAL